MLKDDVCVCERILCLSESLVCISACVRAHACVCDREREKARAGGEGGRKGMGGRVEALCVFGKQNIYTVSMTPKTTGKTDTKHITATADTQCIQRQTNVFATCKSYPASLDSRTSL